MKRIPQGKEGLENIVEQMRENQETYRWFWDNVIKALLSKNLFSDTVLQVDQNTGNIVPTNHCDMIRPMGEAFALLCVENYWERCNFEATQEYEGVEFKDVPPGEIVYTQTKDSDKRIVESNKYKTRYNSTEKPAPGKTKLRSTDWNQKGINRLQELRAKVVQDRIKNGAAFNRVWKSYADEVYSIDGCK